MPYGSICCTFHQLKYSYPNCSSKKKTRATQNSLTEVKGNTDQENGSKAENDKTEIATGLGRRKREEIYRKVGSNWQP